MIDYGHMRDGVLYHGTISDLDGEPLATWTYELHGEKTTQTRQLSEEAFDAIWNGLVDSQLFKSCLVTDAQAPVDPVSNHIIALFYADKDSQVMHNYSIPANEHDPAFLRWIELIEIPKGSL